MSDYPQHSKDGGIRRTVAMRPDVKPDSEHVEYLALGHPVVDDLVARVTASSYAGSAAAFEISSDELPPGAGWFIVYELGVASLKDVRELAAYFVDDDSHVDSEVGRSLLLRAAQFPNDHGLSPSDVPVEQLDAAIAAAEDAGFARLGELEAQATSASEDQLGRERLKVAGYFDYRDQAARDRLASSTKVLANLELSDQAETRRIIPVWRANVARDERLIEELHSERAHQLAQLEHRAVGGGDLRLVAVARIEITGGVEQ